MAVLREVGGPPRRVRPRVAQLVRVADDGAVLARGGVDVCFSVDVSFSVHPQRAESPVQWRKREREAQLGGLPADAQGEVRGF